ncbi:MAG: hypothetical protein ABF535_12850 [Acetobacter sp.]
MSCTHERGLLHDFSGHVIWYSLNCHMEHAAEQDMTGSQTRHATAPT